jgi:pSer/pThr/pTyr-binding forkhead associated (FHA) protein
LSDFGSINGTYVNDQKINGEVSLRVNDIVGIGNTTRLRNNYFAVQQPENNLSYGSI